MLTYTVNLNAQFNNLYSNFVGYGIKIITPSDFGVIIGDNMQTQSALAFGTPYYNTFTKLQIFNTNYQLYNGTATIYILQSTSEEFPLASPVTIGIGSNPIQVTSITDPINVNQIASAITVSTITEPIDVNILTKNLTVGAITNPVDVNLITQSVTVGAITNPVNVNINSSTTTLPISGTVSANITNATVPISGSVNVSSGSINVNNIVNPVNVNLLTKSVTVSAITNPVAVNINSGTVAVSSITNPVNINTITKAVTVGSITNPVAVNINSGTVAVSSITNPVNINTITKAVTIGSITNPVNVNINSSSATLPISGTVTANISGGSVNIGTISGAVSISTGTVITGTSTKVAPTVTTFNADLTPAASSASTYTFNMPNTSDLFLVQIYMQFYAASSSPDYISVMFNNAIQPSSTYPLINFLYIACTSATMNGGWLWTASGGNMFIQFQVAGIHDISIEYFNNEGIAQTNGVPIHVYVINEKQSNISLQF